MSRPSRDHARFLGGRGRVNRPRLPGASPPTAMNIIDELTKRRGRAVPDSMVRSPFREGLRTTGIALAAALVTVVIGGPSDILHSSHDSPFYVVIAGTVFVVACIGFASSYLGSRIGCRGATTIVKVFIAAIVLPVLIVIAVRSLLSL